MVKFSPLIKTSLEFLSVAKKLPSIFFASQKMPSSSSGLGRSPLKAETGVRLPVGVPKRTHPEPHQIDVEQFLEMLRFDQRSKLEELPLIRK